MGTLALVLIILGVIILIPGLIVGTLKFLIWIAAALILLSIIAWAIRSIRGRNSTEL